MNQMKFLENQAISQNERDWLNKIFSMMLYLKQQKLLRKCLTKK